MYAKMVKGKVGYKVVVNTLSSVKIYNKNSKTSALLIVNNAKKLPNLTSVIMYRNNKNVFSFIRKY